MSELNVFGLREYTRQDILVDATDEVRYADRFYIVIEADAAIAELKAEKAQAEDDKAFWKTKCSELKQKLHDAEMRADLAEAGKFKAEHHAKLYLDERNYAEKCERQTLRALWLARAERANDKQTYYTHLRSDGWVHLVDKWINVERLCRAKADTFREAENV